MTDLDRIFTRQLNRLRRRILRVYSQARQEMTDQLTEFLEHFQQLEKGEITKEAYQTWLRNQVFQSELMHAKLDSITQICTTAQQTAYKLARDEQYNIFATGANYAYYELEQQAGVAFGLTLYNTEAVKRLFRENPKLVPNKRIKSESNKTYDARVFNRYVTQGIIQGKGVREIAEQAVNGMADTEIHWAMNNAITALTGAQNAGTLQQLRNARALGIETRKRWNSTLDYRTRTMHRLLDQETAALDEPFEVEGYEIMYPGDPDAAPEMVYHCRCKLSPALLRYPRQNAARRDNTTGEIVPEQSYQEWYASKQGTGTTDEHVNSARTSVPKFGRSEGSKAAWAAKINYYQPSVSERGKGPITQITDSAIDSVPYVSIRGFAEEQNMQFQELHKELLRTARKENKCFETAFIVSSDLKRKTVVFGNEIEIFIPKLSTGLNSWILHNHPRNSSFSIEDVAAAIDPGYAGITIVKNNGGMEVLTKLADSDNLRKMHNDIRRLLKKNPDVKDADVAKMITKWAEKGWVTWTIMEKITEKTP